MAWYTNMAAVSLFWNTLNTNMAAVTSCENVLYKIHFSIGILRVRIVKLETNTVFAYSFIHDTYYHY